MTIANPILPGFNPDPSICRRDDTFYIATSTFEWYPGIQIFSSQDLANWDLVTRPLSRAEQLDMRGNPDSTGVWAPCLSYADGLFWLVYTDVKRYDGNYKDTHNYLVTSSSIEGPWSDPVYLNSRGFDPSLFHDDDGKKYILNMFWDYRATRPNREGTMDFFGGILMQEYNHMERKLVGPTHKIFEGSLLGATEGPHIYKRNGYYYLITAEGGTGYNHAVTHARARSLTGPYELHPQVHPLTSKDTPSSAIQRVGHGQFVELNEGEVVHSFLCSRPLKNPCRSPLGRETGIDILEWRDDGWLYRKDGSQVPSQSIPSDHSQNKNGADPLNYEFSNEGLHEDFQWLRTPYHDRIFSLSSRPGYLRLFGREAIGSWFEQSLVARRQDAFSYSAEAELEFSPENSLQMAGITAYYNRYQFYYLYVTQSDDGNKILDIQTCAGNWPEASLEFPHESILTLPEGPIGLGVDVEDKELRFRYSVEGVWQPIGPVLDTTILSDEAGRGEHANFTGAFIGMAAQDLNGGGHHADFRHFKYQRTL